MKNNISAYIKAHERKLRSDRGKPRGAARPVPAVRKREKERGR